MKVQLAVKYCVPLLAKRRSSLLLPLCRQHSTLLGDAATFAASVRRDMVLAGLLISIFSVFGYTAVNVSR